MSGNFTPIDISQLPKPAVVETLSFETILAEMLADLQARDPTFTALVESDPAYKILEVAAYRELMLRARINDAACAVMLAYAEDSDLDNIGANYDCLRLTITPEDDTTIPPTPAVMELDDAYRARIQLSREGYTCAGPTGAYQFFSLSASGDVLDVSVTTPQPGTILVSVLSQTGDGTAPAGTIAAVTAALSDETVRPLCDTVLVSSAGIVYYSINALLTIYPGFDAGIVTANALTAIQAYVASRRKVGRSIAVALVNGALGVAGVENIALLAPGITADVAIGATQAAYCSGITVNVGGVSD